MTKQEAIPTVNANKEDALNYFRNHCMVCKSSNECCNCDIGVAIECIEKQIPKKPIEKESNFPNHLIVSCPECCHSFGVFIRDDKMSKITTYRSAKFNAWCPSCGNKLDWSDNE